MNEKPERAVPLRDRRKLLRVVRDTYGITLVELGKAADLSNPMLSQFETGARDLSTEAWARVVVAMQKLIPEAKAKRTSAEVSAQLTAERLGIRVEDLKENTSGYAKVLEELLWRDTERLVDQEASDLQKDQIKERIAEAKADFLKSLEQMSREELAVKYKAIVIAIFNQTAKFLDLHASGNPLPLANEALAEVLGALSAKEKGESK